MSQSFDERERYTFEYAKELATTPSAWIKHLLDNEDGTFSVMGHITCEQCDYCDAEYADGFELWAGMVHKAKDDAYEGRNALEAAKRLVGEGEE